MRGYPKNLNTKFDYQYVIAQFTDTPSNKAAVVRDLKDLLDSAQGWFFVKKLENEAAGVNDDTHMVVEEKEDMNSENVTYAQYELRDNPTAKIFSIGYTKAEVEKLIADLA